MLAIVQRDGAQCSRRARQVTGRTLATLEEIEERLAMVSKGLRPAVMSHHAPDLLAIAQGQREELERLRKELDQSADDYIPSYFARQE